MYDTRDTFEDLPILAELRASLDQAFATADLRQTATRDRRDAHSRPASWARTPARASRRQRRRIALAGGVAVAGLAIAGVFGFQGSGFTPSPAVAATMDQLAQIAAGQDWGGIPGPGQYLYTQSESMQRGYTVQDRQAWFPATGRMLLSDAEANADAGQVVALNGPYTYFPTTVSGWRSLSTDPATLLQQIHELDAPNAADTPAEQFTNVGDALRETPIPPASRAVLYRAVALIPGVQLMGPQTDPTGQAGLGVGYYADGKLQSELIFDQQTARLLGELDYDQTGELTFAASYIEQEIVDSAPSVGSMPPDTQYPRFLRPAS